jgi:aspartate/methionine/tyrosine aminotransferase
MSTSGDPMDGTIEPFLLERYFARYEFAVPYLLCASDCETVTVDELLAIEDGARDGLYSLRLGYVESNGSPALREAIAATYDGVSPDEVVAFAGAEEAIYAFMRAVLRPGDRAAVHVPCYQSLESVARAQGCAVDRWEAVEEDGWAPSLRALERTLTPQTRAIVVNTPHNPTGFAFDERGLRELARTADERGIVLFCDEVYRRLELDVPTPPAACELSRSAVSLGVLSKAYGLAGLRIGWIATHNEAVRRAVAAYKDYLSICNGAPSEYLATIALRNGDALLRRNRDLARRNRALLDAFFARRPDRFSWTRPKAGPIGFARVHGEEGAQALCDRLARDAGVLLLPSGCYGHGDRHVRVGYGRSNFPEALAKLEAALA